MADLREMFAEAIRCHQAGDLQGAQLRYEQILQSHPDHPDALHLCGMTCYQSGDAAAAEPLLRSAISLQPQHRDYHSNLGLVLMKLGRAEEAIASYLGALALDPDHQDALLNLANAYLSQDAINDAETMLRRLLQNNPLHAPANNSLGVILSGDGRHEESLTALESALRSQPDYADAHANLGQLLIKMNRDPEAARHLERAVTLKPDDLKTLRVWASVLQDIGDYELALQKYQQALALDPNDPLTHVGLGSLYKDWKKYEQAEHSYHQALNIEPENTDALNDLGALHMVLDNPDIALRCFEGVIKRLPKQASSQYNCGAALLETGDVEAAKSRFIEALSIQPDLGQAYRSLANIYNARGDLDAAMEVLLRWRENVPDAPAPAHMLAAWDQSSVPPRASDDYVKDEFDRFADVFDKTLATLDYQAPGLVTDLLQRQANFSASKLCALDAGCGTGLAAALVRAWCSELVGVDLSPRMVDLARARNTYDHLEVAELGHFMSATNKVFDLVFCIDTLVYFGDLLAFFKAVFASLKPGGWLGFSVELDANDSERGYTLNPSGRYAHSEYYLRKVLQQGGLQLVELEVAVLRHERSAPVKGLIVAAQKPVG